MEVRPEREGLASNAAVTKEGVTEDEKRRDAASEEGSSSRVRLFSRVEMLTRARTRRRRRRRKVGKPSFSGCPRLCSGLVGRNDRQTRIAQKPQIWTR